MSALTWRHAVQWLKRLTEVCNVAVICRGRCPRCLLR